MVMTPHELAEFLARSDLEDGFGVAYRPDTPIEIMRKLEAEGLCKLYTYTWKTDQGTTELRWRAVVEEK